MLFLHPWIATRPFCHVNRYRKNRRMRYSLLSTLLLQRTTRRDVRIQRGQSSMCSKHPRPRLHHIVTSLRRRNHITPALKELHWLPIRARKTFKVATVEYRLRERRQSPYLADLISDYVPTRTLRSSAKSLLAEPSFRTNIGRRSFRYVAAETWNNLPDDIKTVDSLSLLRKGLKTFLFRQSYCC